MISFRAVNMMDVKASLILFFCFAAYLTGFIVALPDRLFEQFRPLIAIFLGRRTVAPHRVLGTKKAFSCLVFPLIRFGFSFAR